MVVSVFKRKCIIGCMGFNKLNFGAVNIISPCIKFSFPGPIFEFCGPEIHDMNKME